MAGKEDKKNVVWMFDRQTGVMSVDVNKSNKADIEARFSFKLEVYKDSETHVESMKITNFKDRNENGSIVTSIVDLGRDIKDFKRFGVVMGDTYYRDLARRIEEEYVRACLKSFDKRGGKADNKGKQGGDDGECVNIQAISAGKSMKRYERI